MLSGDIQNNKLRILGKLTASLIHEIRNPLSAIKLNLDLIKMEENVSEEILESVNDSLAATGRIEYMVDSLLSFARVVTHGKEQILLNKLILSAIDLLSVKATKYGVSIIPQLDEDISYVFVDQNKLLQVLLNLITNAIESCEENNGGKIVIKTFAKKESSSQKIYLIVEDNGVGISQEDKEKIFEDFYTSKENGTGLGLSVCKMLIKEQNAEIDFESELGKGTKFIITFDENSMRELYETENSNNR